MGFDNGDIKIFAQADVLTCLQMVNKNGGSWTSPNTALTKNLLTNGKFDAATCSSDTWSTIDTRAYGFTLWDKDFGWGPLYSSTEDYGTWVPFWSLRAYLNTVTASQRATAAMQPASPYTWATPIPTTIKAMTYSGSGSNSHGFINFFDGDGNQVYQWQTFNKLATGCSQISFFFGVDSNLMIKTYQSPNDIAKYPGYSGNCKVIWSSGSYSDCKRYGCPT